MNKIKRLISVSLIFIIMLAGNCIVSCAAENVVYVSVNGNDFYGDGTEYNPYQTLEKAKEAATGGSFVIIMKEGEYTLSDMSFTHSDSGLTIKGEGNAVVTEAKKINASEFYTVKNPDILKRLRPEVWGKVYELDLKQYSLDIKDIELFVDGRKMNISRYPNRSEVKGDNITIENRYLVAKNPVTNENTTVFETDDARVPLWQDISDSYITGSVVDGYDWRKRDILGISGNEIEVSGSVRKNAEFCVFNLVEEIDVEGEYAYDVSEEKLYVYLPQNIKTASVLLKKSSDPLIVIKDAENITFKNIKFDKISRQVFESVNSEGLNILNCEFNYISADRALVLDGKNMIISGNKAYGSSGGFIDFSGGEVTKEGFINGNIKVENNLIVNCGDERFRGYMIVCGKNAPNYTVDSIGNYIENNVIYNCGGVGAIGPTGNDLTVKNNEIFNVARHINDGGAIYSGRTNTKIGTVISNNYIHHLNKDLSYVGIYSDDGQGGMTIKNNVIYEARHGILVGAGMNGDFSDNMYINTKRAMALGSRMSWSTSGVFSEPDLSVDESGWYALNDEGQKVLTLYGETAQALSEYPNAYKKYTDLYENSLSRKPFFAPWNTKVNGNVHFTNDSSATLGESFKHNYLDSNGKVLVKYEDEWLKTSGKWEAYSELYNQIDELMLYNGEFLNNKQNTYSKSDFVDFDNQDFTLTKSAPSGSKIENINMYSIGLTDENIYSSDFSFDFTPIYSDGKLKIAFDKSENISKYEISLSTDGSTVFCEEYFDDNEDSAYETKNVVMGKTYEITVTGYSLARQNLSSYTVTKVFKVPPSNDKNALIFVTDLLKNECEKESSGVYVYSDETVVSEMNNVLSNAEFFIEDEEAAETVIELTCTNVLNVLSKAQLARTITRASITSCKVSDISSRVTVKAEDFEPYSQVTIAVTNPKYKKEDIINNTAEAVLRYTDVKFSGLNGEIEFSFNTVVNGVDMPDYFNVYLVDENGREASSSYYYGTLETSDIKFSFGENEVPKDKLSEYKGKILNVTIDVKNRMKNDIDSTVYCGIYEDKRLISLAMSKDERFLKNKVNSVSFDIEIPQSFTDNSRIEVMICDNETLLKPLTVKKSITELK